MADGENMQKVHYPSDAVPGVPEFDISLPADWVVGQVPDVLLVSGPATWDGPFRTNVTVTASLAAKDLDLAELASAYAEDLAGSSPIEIVSFEHYDGDGYDAGQLVLRATLAEPAVVVLQNVVFMRVPNRPADSELANLFTITASCDEARAEAEGPTLLEVVRSFETV